MYFRCASTGILGGFQVERASHSEPSNDASSGTTASYPSIQERESATIDRHGESGDNDHVIVSQRHLAGRSRHAGVVERVPILPTC